MFQKNFKLLESAEKFILLKTVQFVEKFFKKFASYLKHVFRDNRKELKDILEQKMNQTNLPVLEFVKELTRFRSSCIELGNIKVLTDLYDKL